MFVYDMDTCGQDPLSIYGVLECVLFVSASQIGSQNETLRNIEAINDYHRNGHQRNTSNPQLLG